MTDARRGAGLADPIASEDMLEPARLSPEDELAYADAIAFASERHRGQTRKGSRTPYVVHPLEVAALLARDHPTRRTLVTAGLLHDTLEDTRTTRRELEARFGREVARLVAAVTRRPFRAPWALDLADEDVVRLRAADCISNVRATLVDLERDGPATWGRFRGGERAKRAYYARVADRMRSALPDDPLTIKLVALRERLERTGGD